jgi:ubiquinone/menaquinone biosynthesis C-methylase UbiE
MRWVRWAALTAATAVAASWLRGVVDEQPVWRRPAPPAACDPAAARAEQRLADTPAWRWIETWLARRAVRPFRVRPSFRPLRVLNLDHGPGGIAGALARETPQDATIVATDPLAGMADLASHRAGPPVARRGTRGSLHFVRAWTYRLPFVDGAFDLVVGAGALHQWPDPEAALSEVGRVLAGGGRYLVADLRRDLPLWLWILARLAQAALAPPALRALGEPGASIAAAYAPHEAEWLAARARLPDLGVARGPAWLMIERATVPA